MGSLSYSPALCSLLDTATLTPGTQFRPAYPIPQLLDETLGLAIVLFGVRAWCATAPCLIFEQP